MLSIAALIIALGVAKSGSPVLKLTTSMPAACIFFASVETANVADGLT